MVKKLSFLRPRTALAILAGVSLGSTHAQVLQPGDIVMACRSGGSDPTLVVKNAQILGTLWDDPANRGIDASSQVPISWMWTPAQFNDEQIYGTTIDQATGTIYATSSAMYNFFGTSVPTIFKINPNSGAVSVVVTEAAAGDKGFGLVDLSESGYLFTPGMTDGVIYSYNADTGAQVDTFDPFGSSTPGIFNLAPLGQRILGVGFNEVESRLYYSVWHNDTGNLNAGVNNEIRSIEIDASGGFLPGTDQTEIALPFKSGTYSMPVLDIDFDTAGTRMLLSEYGVRTTATQVSPVPHQNRVLEYGGSSTNWTLTGGTSKYKPGSNNANARGGIAWAYHHVDSGELVGQDEYVAFTTDYLRGLISGSFPGQTYGVQYLSDAGGDVMDSILIDGDNDIIGQDKGVYGDLDIYEGVPFSLGDKVWADVDNSGDINGGEAGIPGVEVWVFLSGQDPLTDTPVRTDVTDASGCYLFEGLAQGNYFVYIPPTNFDAGAPLEGLESSNGNGSAPDPDDDVEDDDNGDPDGTHGVRTADVTLFPETEPTDGFTNLSVDFGFYAPVGETAIGSLVFIDSNGNGMLDGAESGVSGVSVQLFEQGDDPAVDAPLATDTTDANGVYYFDGLATGFYFVHIPASEFASGPLAGTASSAGYGTAENLDEETDENGIDSVDPASDGISSVVIKLTPGMEPVGESSQGDYGGTLVDENVNMTVDFGFVPAWNLVAVGNLVWGDTDGDGAFEPGDGEAGIENVTVQLFPAGADPLTDPPLGEVLTDSSGCYVFDNLAPGEYFVYVPGYEFDAADPDSDLDGLASSPFVDAGDNDDDVATSDNGIDDPDAISNGISSASFELFPKDEPVAESGKPGYPGTLGDDHVDLTVDLGFVDPSQLVAVGNVLFYDGLASNTYLPTGNFINPTSSDAPVSSALVELFRDGDDPATDAPIATTVTTANGCYYFDRLPAGDYFIHVGPEEFDGDSTDDVLWGWFPIAGGDTSDEDHELGENSAPSSNPTVIGVNSTVFNLTPGAEPTGEASESDCAYPGTLADANVNSTIDMGFRPTADFIAIGNLVFEDTDNDGAFEPGAGETGIGGVTVELYEAGDVPGVDTPVATQVTDASGCYLFDMIVKFPSGWTAQNFFVHIPADEFATGELSGMVSSSGDGPTVYNSLTGLAIDDNTDENGVDSLDPVSTGISSATVNNGVWDSYESGKSGPATVLTGYSTNYTIDFGFHDAPVNQVALGNLIFEDIDNDGVFTSGVDAGVDGVLVELYAAGSDPATSAPLATQLTHSGGCYLFGGLTEGDYFVNLPASNFLYSSRPLYGLVSVTGSGADAAGDDDAEENGIDSTNPVATGVRSVDVTLAAGTEPTETGKDAAMDDSMEASADLTLDLGFVEAATTLTVGNLVFFDGNDDGIYDPAGGDSGVDGVTVELYADGDTPGVDSPIATTTTSGGGCYSFTGLSAGDYFVHIPAANFAVGAALEATESSAGVESAAADDDGGENGIDGNAPADGISSATFALAAGTEPEDAGIETGKNAAADNVADSNGDLSIDLGFTSVKVDTYAEFQTEFSTELGTENQLGDNPDGDIYSNALEYALCLHPADGSQAKGFCVGLDTSLGLIDALFYRRRGGVSDVIYTLQSTTALGTSTTWTDRTDLTPVVETDATVPVDAERVRYEDLESEVGQTGFVRLKVEVGGETHYTQVFGWDTIAYDGGCQTSSAIHANKGVYSGTAVSGDYSAGVLDVSSAGGDVAAELVANTEYYIEFIDGAFEGHRFDLDEAATTASSIAIDLTNARNTLDPVPAGLDGPYEVRAHVTLDELADPALWAPTLDPATGDRTLVFNGSTWDTYWVTDINGVVAPQWTKSDDGSLSDSGGLVIDPCQGFFLHPKGGSVDITRVGVVRSWDFACPLALGSNLVGGGYPIDMTPASRAMKRDDGDGSEDWFNGSNDPTQADQIMSWIGDDTVGATGYDSHFRLYLGLPGVYDHWTDQGNSSLASAENDVLFKIGRATFIRSTDGHDKADQADVWIWPAPWAP